MDVHADNLVNETPQEADSIYKVREDLEDISASWTAWKTWPGSWQWKSRATVTAA